MQLFIYNHGKHNHDSSPNSEHKNNDGHRIRIITIKKFKGRFLNSRNFIFTLNNPCSRSCSLGDSELSYLYQKHTLPITLFSSIAMFYGTDNIMWNISSFGLNVKNILQNIVKPT